MMTRYYRFAGVNVAVSMPEALFYEEEYRLAAFRTEQTEDPYEFQFQMQEKLLPPEGQLVLCRPDIWVFTSPECTVRYIGRCNESWETAAMRAEYRNKRVEVQLNRCHFPGKVGVGNVLDCLAAEHLIARKDGFILHCSCIERNGKAILFTAPSGTGKSTQADLWHQYRGTEIINGDRIAVRKTNGVLTAEGIPYAGSSQYCQNRSLPLEAVVYLHQAPENTIRKLRGYEAFSKIWEGVSVNTWNREDLERVSAVIQTMVSRIPVFYLSCTPDEGAVVTLEENLPV